MQKQMKISFAQTPQKKSQKSIQNKLQAQELSFKRENVFVNGQQFQMKEKNKIDLAKRFFSFSNTLKVEETQNLIIENDMFDGKDSFLQESDISSLKTLLDQFSPAKKNKKIFKKKAKMSRTSLNTRLQTKKILQLNKNENFLSNQDLNQKRTIDCFTQDLVFNQDVITSQDSLISFDDIKIKKENNIQENPNFTFQNQNFKNEQNNMIIENFQDINFESKNQNNNFFNKKENFNKFDQKNQNIFDVNDYINIENKEFKFVYGNQQNNQNKDTTFYCSQTISPIYFNQNQKYLIDQEDEYQIKNLFVMDNSRMSTASSSWRQAEVKRIKQELMKIGDNTNNKVSQLLDFTELNKLSN